MKVKDLLPTLVQVNDWRPTGKCKSIIHQSVSPIFTAMKFKDSQLTLATVQNSQPTGKCKSKILHDAGWNSKKWMLRIHGQCKQRFMIYS